MKKLSVLALVLCLSAGVSVAQFLPQQSQQTGTQQVPQSSPSIQMPSISGNMFTSSSEFFKNLQSQGLLVQPPPYDRTVDTNTYVLGPGDIVNIGIWGATPISYNASITPEGSIIIPTFGVLRVGGMTLAEAKAYARDELSKQFKNSKITLTLIYPRTFYVMVGGAVAHPGRYIVTAFDRVDRAFTLANLSPGRVDTLSFLPNFSLRRIRLVHSNGKTQNVDLLKFYMTGNLSDDPTLSQGDAIVVPREDMASGSISISGAVRMPGNFEYVKGDRIKDLLELCAGLTELADSTRVKVLTWNGSSYDEKIVNLEDSTALYEPLPVNSRVVVPINRTKVNDYYVWVTGEVKVPGLYPISRDSTKLATIIKLAGGFTNWASLSNAVVLRKADPSGYPYPGSAMYDTLSYLYKANGVSSEQIPYITDELLMRLHREQVSTDFVKLFVDNEQKYDCTLRSGDSIYVPTNHHSVYVFGQVRYPGYVTYHDGWSYSNYVEEAGGYTDASESGKVKIIKGGTLQWYNSGGATIMPGDMVFVPKVPIKPELFGWNLFLSTFGAVASIVTAAATVVLVIRTHP